jgi:hypothetical protein
MEHQHPHDEDTLLRAAIEAEKERITVEPYATKTMLGGLQGHARGFWSGTAMGIITGAGVGAILCAAFGGPLLQLVLGVAAVGSAIGGTIGSRVGSATGVVSAALEEREKRERGRELEQEIMASPEKQDAIIAKFKENPVIEKNGTLRELFSTTSPDKHMYNIVKWKTMLVTVALGAAAGAIIFGGGFLATGTVALAGHTFAQTLAGAFVLGAAVGGMTGATFAINFPLIFASLGNGVVDLLSGNAVEGKSIHKDPALTQEKIHEALAAEARIAEAHGHRQAQQTDVRANAVTSAVLEGRVEEAALASARA